ncbi:TerC family integral membrane protein [Saccharopolyspora erythraea NRRL 2338]|uniref:Tellurium resistance membrane protein n=2 Tax=Saccharopolyspora erythraea TaxID=1836 RepID=A4FFX8_SACEN|nr:TerC/Alx family metal homeostasis membrane protein [Saccharopolyspora erythraea]EQD84016.1 tellurium resistance protein TerC [Saccharopolyspora erythraea D]PFG96659.1 TerC family integral membrane protein [Saccharopolyspora erythraea NRRL 2338]QRK93139.1 TerC/Alx family metal homeostasis membrane protein [Saccharopolyspora erythraea]CAM02953.1 tellurium resistance membrane protein [Saccharopolyspora erythraea NRRL 2338]
MATPAAVPAAASESIGTPWLWAVSIAVLLALLVVDFVVTRRPHEVSLREAVGWSVFYLALPLVFGVGLWLVVGTDQALEFITGFVVEKSLSVDNLFVFMLLLTGFAVPAELQQRVLLYGIAGALVLRGVFIAAGAALLQAGTWAFLVFGAILFATAIKILHEALRGEVFDRDVSQLRSVRLLRRLMPITEDYQGARLTVRQDGRLALTPFTVVVVAVFATDVVFAVDSVPAVYGITEDPYLVFTTNAFALLGLRALYFVLHTALAKLAHLNHGLAVILAFIGVKLVLHWAHGIWPAVPEIPTLLSLAVIVLVLAVVTLTSFYANRRAEATPGS